MATSRPDSGTHAASSARTRPSFRASAATAVALSIARTARISACPSGFAFASFVAARGRVRIEKLHERFRYRWLAQSLKCIRLDLTNPLPRHAQFSAQVRQRLVVARADAVAGAEHVRLPRIKQRKRLPNTLRELPIEHGVERRYRCFVGDEIFQRWLSVADRRVNRDGFR